MCSALLSDCLENPGERHIVLPYTCEREDRSPSLLIDAKQRLDRHDNARSIREPGALIEIDVFPMDGARQCLPHTAPFGVRVGQYTEDCQAVQLPRRCHFIIFTRRPRSPYGNAFSITLIGRNSLAG